MNKIRQKNLFCEQYDLVRSSRRVLLDYCGTLHAADFVKQVVSFGHGGSIRNTLVHIANVYEHWIARFTLKKDIAYSAQDAFVDTYAVAGLFSTVDDFVNEFINIISESDMRTIEGQVNGELRNFTPLALFTHVITHEYHHKGQVLSMSRHLGYTPVDTDMIR
ncbi:DinB family protein [Parapedobacter sp. ISTM3]|uniref:DinB family protein n=1 Tax=Parapedobacter sp. ISTM3 TaxID=2800130 RepID=UPI0019062CFF|nr:DinB family protein [Parapedobacter sp. ISTM3]MBK1441480.1 DinB family protein [Parapedobacter sp. ISTM3]